MLASVSRPPGRAHFRGGSSSSRSTGRWPRQRQLNDPTSQPTQRTVSLSPSEPDRHDGTSRISSEAPIVESHRRANHVFTQFPNDDSIERIIIALDVREKGKVGCAYYVASEERLLCMEEIAGGGIEILEKLKIDLQPTTVILSPRFDAAGDSADMNLRRQSSLVEDDDRHRPLPYEVDIRPTPEFGYENALSKLLSLSSNAEPGNNVQFLIPGELTAYDEELLPQDLGLSARRGRILQISSWLDLDNKISIGCAGAVVGYLQRKRAAEFLPDDPNACLAWRVTRLEMFSLKGTMLVNADTLVSLQVIQPESHPNAFNQGPGTSGSKESLSLYGVFHSHARTPHGKASLRRNFLRPSLNVDEINTRLDFVSVFARPDNRAACEKLSKSLIRVKNMRTTVILLQKGIDSGKQNHNAFKSGVWNSLLEFCYHTIDIAETLGEVLGAAQLPICIRASDVLDGFQLRRIGRRVLETVDHESSADQHRTVVKRGVNEQLDEVKDVYDGMDELLSQKAIEVARLMPHTLNVGLNVIYFPHLGFHLTVPLDEATGQAVYNGTDLGWERMFTTQNQVYFKDATMHEMDHDLGDLYTVICNYEIEIAYDLAQEILANEKLLIAASDLCGELDCLLALAHVAYQYKLVRPCITEENMIQIKGGRHLLYETSVSSFVPNDTFLVGGSGQEDADTEGPSMILLTGPNYSGKSVYQKQVALIVYMAQVGSFIPAESATIGITDKILTRITTRETVSKVQSAFMIDIQQIAIALNTCTRRSLLLIDECGKGTDACDGAGLAAGVFSHLLSLGANAPRTLAATHFHEIFDLGVFEGFDNIAFAHMEVQVFEQFRGRDGERNSEVIYLYNLRPDRSDLSYGTQCAAMNGVPKEVVERAVELAHLSGQGEDLVATCSALSENDAKDLKDAELAARYFLAMKLEQSMSRDVLMAALDSMLEKAEGAEMEVQSAANS